MMSENICMYIITLSSFSLLEYFIYTVPYGCKKHPHSYVCMLTFPYTACSASPCTYGIRQASPKPHNTMLPIFRLNTSDQYVPSHIYFFTAFYSCLRFLFFPHCTNGLVTFLSFMKHLYVFFLLNILFFVPYCSNPAGCGFI